MLEGLHVPFRSHPVRQVRILPLQWPEDLWLRDQDQVPGRSIWDVQGFDPFGILCMMSDRSLIFPFPCGRSVIIAPCEYFIYSYSFVIVLFSYMVFQYHCETQKAVLHLKTVKHIWKHAYLGSDFSGERRGRGVTKVEF